MEKSLFIPLKAEGLTTMKIRYDFKTGLVKLYAAKEWEPDHDFTAYNHKWWIDGIFTEDAVYLNTKQVWAMFEKYGQKEYLESVIDLLHAGKHDQHCTHSRRSKPPHALPHRNTSCKACRSSRHSGINCGKSMLKNTGCADAFLSPAAGHSTTASKRITEKRRPMSVISHRST